MVGDEGYAVPVETEGNFQPEMVEEGFDIRLVGDVDLATVHHVVRGGDAVAVTTPGDTEDVTLVGLDDYDIPAANSASVAVGAIATGNELDGLVGRNTNAATAAPSVSVLGGEDEIQLLAAVVHDAGAARLGGSDAVAQERAGNLAGQVLGGREENLPSTSATFANGDTFESPEGHLAVDDGVLLIEENHDLSPSPFRVPAP